MSKPRNMLTLSTVDAETGRITVTETMSLADLAAQRPDLADAAKRVQQTGRTEVHPGCYISRSAQREGR